MLYKLKLYSLWAATIVMLLATVVTHHHHSDMVCIAADAPTACTGDAESEGTEHAAHHAADTETCRIHQLQHFIISKGTAAERCAAHSPLPPHTAFAAATAQLPAVTGTVRKAAAWRRRSTALTEGAHQCVMRRGPPQKAPMS